MSMDYALAKELKDAGFPYKSERLHFDGSVETAPTLSELIEACALVILSGNGWRKPHQSYFELSTNVNHSGEIESIGKLSEWRASVVRGVDDGYNGQNNYFGSTPEEAVARLWLALNKHA